MSVGPGVALSTLCFFDSSSGMITVCTFGFTAAGSRAGWQAASAQTRITAALRIAANSTASRRASRDEQRVVRRGALRVRTAGRVVVERHRLARHPLGRRERMRMSVKGRVGRRENPRAIDRRQDLLAACAHVAIPKLEMPAVLIAPILVEIDEHVQPAIEFQLRMDVEVGVNLQESAGLDLMQSAAAEVWIGDQSLDAGERLEPKQHLE